MYMITISFTEYDTRVKLYVVLIPTHTVPPACSAMLYAVLSLLRFT